MQFRILGPLEVAAAGRPVPLPRAKQRALVAVLVLEAGQVVSTDRLLDALWGERPPSTAKASLQNTVSQVRRLLGADVLVTRPPGYLLAVGPDEVDHLRFARLVEDAGGFPAAERAARLTEALALWRGPALADLAFEPFAEAEVARLEELRLVAEEELAEAELELGRHTELVPRLEALTAANPVRERLRGQLMLALYRAGRQADALEVYQETRRTLVEELGIEPSPVLRELEQAVLRHDPSLDAAQPAAARAPERRRPAVVLYAELTTPAGGDAEAARRGAGRVLNEIRAAIEYHGGTIERLAGDDVLAVFGVPVAHEDDAARAVRAAAQMRRALAPVLRVLAAEQGMRIEVRTGIAGGEVLASGPLGRIEVTGEPVVDARRLAREAAAGEVAVAPGVSSAVRAAITPRRRARSALVGRTRELDALRGSFEETQRTGRAHALTVVGDPGIGKSRLADEFVSSLPAATTLLGRCVSYGDGATYLPLREALGALGELPDDEPRALEILRRVTGLDQARNETPTGEAFWAAARVLEALARRRPLVVVLEDVHWAEPTFLDLVEHLAARVDAPLLLLCLARPELLDVRPGWRDAAIELAPLTPSDVASLIDGDAPGRAARERIVELAGGNPLFAEQLLALAREEGVAALETVPPSLDTLLRLRLDRLPDDERATLERAAVVGTRFWAGALLAITPPIDVPAVGRHLAELERKGLVDRAQPSRSREDAYRFHHVLIRDTAYRETPKESRSDLHERVGDWLEEAGAAEELVGHHLEQAYVLRTETGLVDRRARRLAADAGERLGAAGVRAWRHADAPAAAKLLGRATALLPAQPDLLRELGSALWAVGDVGAATRALEESLAAAHDRAAELRARLDLAYMQLLTDPDARTEQLLELAAAAIPVFEAVEDQRFLAWTWLVVASVHGGMHCRYGACMEAAEQALSHYRRYGWVPATCFRELGGALYHGPTPVSTAARRLRGLLPEADVAGAASVQTCLAGLEAMRGRFTVARELLAASRRRFVELGWESFLPGSWEPVAADVEALAGELDEAERLLRASCAALERGGATALLATRATTLARLLADQDRLDEADEALRAAERFGSADDATVQPARRAVRARLLARCGAADDALALAGEAVELLAGTEAPNEQAAVLLDAADALRAAGQARRAAPLVARAVDLYERKENRTAARRARARLELVPRPGPPRKAPVGASRGAAARP